jgi:hypothetical protein
MIAAPNLRPMPKAILPVKLAQVMALTLESFTVDKRVDTRVRYASMFRT